MNLHKYIPDILSISRIILSVLLLFLLNNILQENTSLIIPIIIVILIILTDKFDGYIARKTHTSTQLGSVLDVFADITYMILAYIPLILNNYIPLWFPVFGVLLFMEFILTSQYISKHINNEKQLTFDVFGRYVGLICMGLPLPVLIFLETIPQYTWILVTAVIYPSLVLGLISIIQRLKYCYKISL